MPLSVPGFWEGIGCPWNPTCTEEEACAVLDAEGTLDLQFETSTARLSDARDAFTWMSGGFTTVMNP